VTRLGDEKMAATDPGETSDEIRVGGATHPGDDDKPNARSMMKWVTQKTLGSLKMAPAQSQSTKNGSEVPIDDESKMRGTKW
jgi:hypothetical protein